MVAHDATGDFWIKKCGYKDCDKIFINDDSYDAHVKIHDPDKEIWYHKCGFKRCTFADPRRQEYREHMLKMHGKTVPVRHAMATN